jgi:hypothetical protein
MQAGEIDGSILGAGMWPVCGSNFINRDRTSQTRIKPSKNKIQCIKHSQIFHGPSRGHIQQLIKYVGRHSVIYCRFIEH